MNQKVRKVFAIIILVILLILSTSSYYGIKGIDNLAYVVAIGLDVGDTEKLKLSLQISVPNNGGGDSGSSSQSSSVVVDSIDCSSINTGINLFNSYLGKEVNLSHCKVLIISEELAAQGVNELVSARYYEIAPTSSEYTGYTESITCNEFFSAINADFAEPVAILRIN